TANGQQSEVDRLCGANSMYDIVKFRVASIKKLQTLPLAVAPAQVGDVVYVLPYSTQKSVQCQTAKVTAVDSIGNGAFYYTLGLAASEKTVSCPVMNQQGEVLGMIQHSASNESKESYAISASFGASLNISALTFNDSSLRNILIRKALPDDMQQALVYLFMASSQMKEEEYTEALNEFVSTYPDNEEGYIRRAQLYMDKKPEQAENDFKQALSVSAVKNETNYTIGRTIYQYAIAQKDSTAYEGWSLERAAEFVQTALDEKEEPIYVRMMADILFAQKKYQEAADSFLKIIDTNVGGAPAYYGAAKAKEMIENADYGEIEVLLDSAIHRFSQPYTSDTAPYFYERALVRSELGKNKEAIVDFNLFYETAKGAVSALFYYQREQVEMKLKMFQQAIDDISRATEMEPNDADFWMEKASVHMRVSQTSEAIDCLKQVLRLTTDNAVAYRMLGYCQVMLKNKTEGKQNLEKARDLGDKVAVQLIEKYCK
ncbi:MAG: tetratricopeptide repeat protein, partial [Bacteroidales bacterium]|nr:tetratricopeptide repeat protein [Bacteroidales bacterium]